MLKHIQTAKIAKRFEDSTLCAVILLDAGFCGHKNREDN
jgi:hypothetical protein